MADRTRKPLLNPEAAAFVKGDTTPPAPASVQAAPPPDAQEEGRVRMTVDLPKSLHRRLKRAALDREINLSELTREALAEWLDRRGS